MDVAFQLQALKNTSAELYYREVEQQGCSAPEIQTNQLKPQVSIQPTVTSIVSATFHHNLHIMAPHLNSAPPPGLAIRSTQYPGLGVRRLEQAHQFPRPGQEEDWLARSYKFVATTHSRGTTFSREGSKETATPSSTQTTPPLYSAGYT